MICLVCLEKFKWRMDPKMRDLVRFLKCEKHDVPRTRTIPGWSAP